MSSGNGHPQPDEDGTGEHTLGVDDVFTALAAMRRREVVYELGQRPEGVATVDELVDRLLAREEDTLAEPPVNHRERVTAALLHNHLPRLDELGVVEFDRRSGTVRFRGDAAVEEWIEHAAALSLPGRSPH
jgi:DNA-binding transcriptional ArsR family regulator